MRTKYQVVTASKAIDYLDMNNIEWEYNSNQQLLIVCDCGSIDKMYTLRDKLKANSFSAIAQTAMSYE